MSRAGRATRATCLGRSWEVETGLARRPRRAWARVRPQRFRPRRAWARRVRPQRVRPQRAWRVLWPRRPPGPRVLGHGGRGGPSACFSHGGSCRRFYLANIHMQNRVRVRIRVRARVRVRARLPRVYAWRPLLRTSTTRHDGARATTAAPPAHAVARARAHGARAGRAAPSRRPLPSAATLAGVAAFACFTPLSETCQFVYLPWNFIRGRVQGWCALV